MVESHSTDFDNENAKEVYFHVCQAFDVGFNSRDVNLTLNNFSKVRLFGRGHFLQIQMQTTVSHCYRNPPILKQTYMSRTNISKMLIIRR